MTRTALLAMFGGILSIGAGAAAADQPVPGEAKLLRALQFYVAAKPVNCLTLRRIRSTRIIDRTAIIYEVGGTLYVNRPRSGAESLSASHVLVTRTPTGEICRGEVVQLFDAASKISSGSVLLGEFVPYRKKSQGDFRQRHEYSKSRY